VKTLVFAALTAVLAVPALTSAQAKTDFTGVWIYNQAQCARGTSGNSPVVSFPTEIHIKQSPGELQWEGHTVRQDSVTAVFKLDGTEVPMKGNEETTLKGKATMEGDKLVIVSSRSYSSPIGDIVTDYKEVYSLSGNVLTIEKTQSTGGVSNTLKAVYNKMS